MPKPPFTCPDANLEIVGERLSKANEQFQMVEDLLNTSVGHHNHKFGLVNGCDPQGFRVTAVIRCQDSHLWEHYQHVKQNTVAEHENRLHASQGSAYLRDKPMKTPLLDAAANEYWLFHGTSQPLDPDSTPPCILAANAPDIRACHPQYPGTTCAPNAKLAP